MKIFWIVGGFIALASVAYAAAELSNHDKNYSWRYKMIVEIDTPEGIKSGSAVREANINWKVIDWSKVNNAPIYSTKHNVLGEAVVVDLGEHGKIFTLIDDTSYVDAMNAFNLNKYEEIEALSIGSQAEFDVSKYPGGPRIVSFKDIQDPKSVQLVMAWNKSKGGTYVQTENRMEELFGEGVKLKGITVEITDEPVTKVITDKWLSWLPHYYDQRLDGNRFGTIKAINKTANALSAGAFSTGEVK